MGQTANCGRRAPYNDRQSNHEPAVASVCIARDRKCRQSVEGRERQAGQQPQLAVVETQLVLDVILKQRENLTVDIAEYRDQKEQRECDIAADNGNIVVHQTLNS